MCLTLCDPMDCGPPGSTVHGILQAKILDWVAILSSRGSFQPRDGTQVSYISCNGRWVFCLPLVPFRKPFLSMDNAILIDFVLRVLPGLLLILC